MFRQRALSAIIGLPILYGLILLDGFPWAYGLPLLAVVVAVSMYGTEELRRMMLNRGFHAPKDMGLMMGALPPLFLYFYHYDYNNIVLFVLTIAIVVDVLVLALGLIGDLSRRMAARALESAPAGGSAKPQPAKGPPAAHRPQEPPGPGGTVGALRDFVLLAVGAMYIGGLLSYLIFLRRFTHAFAPPWDVWAVALLIAAVWISDTVAFAAGKLLDGPKLWPRVSPGKTIVGTAAGIAACAIVFACVTVVASIESSRVFVAAFAAVGAAIGAGIGLAGLGGDLAESAVKRWARVKDSGDLLPGHGGILDRFDSLMWAAPAFFYILTFVMSQPPWHLGD